MRLDLHITAIVGDCFNPRICKRCDLTYNPEHLPKNVSIHASVKDATRVGVAVCLPFSVSIHASVKDATLFHLQSIVSIQSFNPRICKRCDKDFIIRPFTMKGFNPRICKRCDP